MTAATSTITLGRSGALHVAMRTSEPGQVELPPLREHLLRIHVGPVARAQCRERSYRYTPGDIDVMPAGVAGTWTGFDRATSLEIGVPPAVMQRAARELGRDPARVSVSPRHQVRDPRIEHVAWALEAEQRLGFPAGRAFADGLVLALAYHMLGSYAAEGGSKHGLSERELRRLYDYVEAHLDRDLSLVRLARVAGLSASHLTAMFKRATGLAVHEYVMRRRVERAKLLLVQGRLTPSEIALESGFSHQSHMARWTRRVLGVTPSALARRA